MLRKTQPCTINGVRYESENRAAKVLNIGLGTVRHRLQSSNYPGYVSKYHPKKDCSNENLVPCSIAEIEYESIRQAARALGMSPYKVKRRLASFDYPDCVCAKYPKQALKVFKYKMKGKLYKTLVEGSSQRRKDKHGQNTAKGEQPETS